MASTLAVSFVVMISIISVILGKAVLSTGSSLLSDEQTQLWTDLNDTMQAATASQLVTAVETSAFMRADVIDQPRSVYITDQSNIGKLTATINSF